MTNAEDSSPVSPVPGPRPTELLLVRRERVADHSAIDAVHRAAFAPMANEGEPVEVGLVHALRADDGWVPALSLVAEDATGAVVGHVVCTVGSLTSGSAVGLGPLGVSPTHQRRGVGAALMHAVVGAADALGFDVVVLLGHLDYYARFGFVPARRIGIAPTDAGWGDHFQARPLAGWTEGVGGTFRYAAPFEAL